MKFVLPCIIALGIIPVAIASEGTAQESKTEYYHVIGNKVDGNTFLGWRQYESACINCHGPGATGSDTAPDLTASIKRYSPRDVLVNLCLSHRADSIFPKTHILHYPALHIILCWFKSDQH